MVDLVRASKFSGLKCHSHSPGPCWSSHHSLPSSAHGGPSCPHLPRRPCPPHLHPIALEIHTYLSPSGGIQWTFMAPSHQPTLSTLSPSHPPTVDALSPFIYVIPLRTTYVLPSGPCRRSRVTMPRLSASLSFHHDGGPSPPSGSFQPPDPLDSSPLTATTIPIALALISLSFSTVLLPDISCSPSPPLSYASHLLPSTIMSPPRPRIPVPSKPPNSPCPHPPNARTAS